MARHEAAQNEGFLLLIDVFMHRNAVGYLPFSTTKSSGKETCGNDPMNSAVLLQSGAFTFLDRTVGGGFR